MKIQSRQILNDEDIVRIREDALRILSQIGIQCTHERSNRLLCENSKISLKNGRLYFDVDETAEFFQAVTDEIIKKNVNTPAQRNFTMGGNWNSLELLDPITNRPRPAGSDEVALCARIASALGAKNCPVPVSPFDVPPYLKTVACERIAVTQTPSLGGWLTATRRDEIQIISQMHITAGRKYTLGLEGLITPLRMNPVVFDTYFDWCDSPDVEIGIMGGIPVAGTTAPMCFPSNLALALAEAIALDFIFDRLSNGRHRVWNLRLELASMRNANLVYGTPEHCHIIQSVCELNEGLFGIKPTTGSFRTNAKVVDAQTVMERMGVFMFQASHGARHFSSVGQLSVDEVYSPVQAVIDGEILRYGQRLFGGLGEQCFDREYDTVELLREGISEQGFLSHPTTLESFRGYFDFESLAGASFLSEWRNAGSKPLEALAWEKAEKLVSEYSFGLSDEQNREIDGLYSQAKKILEV